MIVTPDRAVTRPVWFGTFALEFENQTGQEVDFDKIAANDEAYMAEYAEAIQAATDAADLESVRAGATDNPFLGIVNSMRETGESSFKTTLKAMNSYMTRFLVFEFVTFRTGLNSMVNSGAIKRKDGIKLMTAVMTRMVAYVFIAQQLRDMLDKLFIADDDEEFENTITEDFYEAFENAIASLLIGGTYGALLRGAGATAYEYQKKAMYEDMGLDFTYDDQTLIPLINPIEGQPYKTIVQAGVRASGPYNPQARLLELGIRKYTEKEKKETKALIRSSNEKLRFGIEALGLMGMIPFYKDLRRLFVTEIYKDLDKDDSPDLMEQRVKENLEKLKKEAKKKSRAGRPK